MVCSRYPKEYRYYETILKRKCLTKLKNNVWESKTKWKLVDKANSYCRRKLLCKYFSMWMAYVVERYKKEINVRLANSFYEERLKTRGILALKKNIEQNRMLMRICRKKFEWNLKFRLWHQWKHYTQKRLKVKEIKLLANRIREERIRIRYIYLWLLRLNERRSQVDAFEKITAKYETKIKEKYFNSWKIFTSRKKFKKKIESLAITCHEGKVLERYFHSWKKYFLRKKRYKSQVEVLKTFYECHLIKNYLTQWWGVCKKVKLERKLTNYKSARDFYTRKLLERSFRILWKAREARRGMFEKMKEFHSRYEKIYISYYLNVCFNRRTEKLLWNIYETKALKWREDWLTNWALMKLMEKNKERMEEKEEMSNVVKYSNSITMHKAFRGWIEVTARKINKKIKAKNACEFHDERMMQKTFKKWKAFVFKKFQKKMADDYYKNTLLLKVINQWRIFIEERKMRINEAKNLERMRKMKLVKEVFTCWKNELDVVKIKSMTAIYFCSRSKLSKVFYIWREFARNKILSKNRYNVNRKILNNIVIKSVIFRWNEIYLQRQCLKKELERLKVKREKRLLSLCFINWTKLVEQAKRIREAVLCYPQMKSCLLVEEYFALMLEALELKKVAKRKQELAKRTEEKLLKRKYLKKMISFVCWKKEKILRCMSEERSKETKQSFDVTMEKSTRRKPIIPDFLKNQIQTEDFEDEVSLNEETFRVTNPTNRKLPVVGHRGAFAFFNS